MSPIGARPFRRGDREQLTDLVNAHAAEHERLARRGGWAGLGNLRIAPGYRRRGVATWLLRLAGQWLRLAQVERLLGYAYAQGRDETGQDYHDYRAFLGASGFRELTRTRRGWTRAPGAAG
jgi:GNAT superfamily N-acetyltransferase